MTISSVASSVPNPAQVVSTASPPPTPPAKADGDSNDANAVQPAPLPPGQGTRVDQLA